MSRNHPLMESYSESGAMMRGVDLFSVGAKRGKEWTGQHLDEMVDNFNKFNTGSRPGFTVPAVRGHDEGSLEKTDIPTDAQLSKVWREGDYLKGNLSNVTPEMRYLLRTKRYHAISPEIYNSPKDAGLEGSGKMLRRIAFLGGEIPQDKNLREFPDVEENAEAAPFRRVILKLTGWKKRAGQESYLCFSEVEVQTMNREDMLKKLQEGGFDTSTITDQVPDSFLAECLRCMDGSTEDESEEEEDDTGKDVKTDPNAADATGGKGGKGGNVDITTQPAKPMNYDEEPPDGMSGQDAMDYAEMCSNMKAYAEHIMKYDGSDEIRGSNRAGQLRAMWYKSPADTDYHSEDVPKMKAYAERGLKKYGEVLTSKDANKPAAASPLVNDGKVPAMDKMSEAQVKSIVDAAVKTAVDQVKAEFTPIRKDVESFREENKRETVRAFIRNWTESGHIDPSEMDGGAGLPTLEDELMGLDNVAAVHKFSEGGKTRTLTALQARMERIKHRKPRRIGELVGSERFSETQDAGKEKVTRHYEMYAEQLNKHGITREKFILGYEQGIKGGNIKSADEYINGAA